MEMCHILFTCSGGWPLLNISDGTSWSLNGEQFIQEKLLNSPAFFSLYQFISPTNRSKRSIYVCVINIDGQLNKPYSQCNEYLHM